MKEWKKRFQESGMKKKTRITKPLSDKRQKWQSTKNGKNREGHYIMTKRSIHQDDVTIIYMYPTSEQLNT